MAQDTGVESVLSSALIEMLGKRFDDHDLLIELRTTQALMMQQMNKLIEASHSTAEDHDKRLRDLETARASEAGTQRAITALLAASISTIVSIVGGLIVYAIKSH